MRKSPSSTRNWFIRPYYNSNGRLVAWFKNAERKVYSTRDRQPFVYYYDFKFNIMTGKYI